MSARIRIATRGSELALWQANWVSERLRAVAPGLEVELVVIKTKGDKILDVPLAKVGGKGLFVKEIEEALVDGRADLAVHSLKDVPGELADGLIIAGVSAREDPRDALCARQGEQLDDLSAGARVGTSSLRRMCQLRALRPDLQFESLRGNVPTRLAKLRAGQFDAIVLAAAGLIRLGHADAISERLDPVRCLPAVGQGVLAIETHEDAEGAITLVHQAIHDRPAARCIEAERAFLARMGGGCQTPLAAYATIDGDELSLDALVGQPDGSLILRAHRRGPIDAAGDLGQAAADDILGQGGGAIIEALIEADQ